MTILTTRADYNRKKNLQWIVDTINKAFNLTLYVTDRDDIFLDGYKITGSASRLERLYAYHHFTLLINASLNDLRQSLKSNDQLNITSKATSSVRSSVLNLSDRNNSITYDKTLELLLKTFFEWNNEKTNFNYNYIDPLLYYEQIKDIENELKSEKFLYQATPPFVYTIKTKKQSIEITISNGIITDIKENDLIIEKKQFLGQLFHTVYDNIHKLKTNILSE
jgi:lipoate-protein ligase A